MQPKVQNFINGKFEDSESTDVIELRNPVGALVAGLRVPVRILGAHS